MQFPVDIAHILQWRSVPEIAIDLSEKSASLALAVRKAINELPQDGFMDLWYSPAEKKFQLNVGDWIDEVVLDRWKSTLKSFASNVEVLDESGGPDGSGYTKIAERPLAARCFTEKRAVSPTMSTIAQLTGMKKGLIPGTPNALIGSLTGGLLGAGLGYGAGWVGEKVLPEKWRRGRLRRTLAMIGGLAGATPGIIGMYSNYRSGRPFFRNAPEPTTAADDVTNLSATQLHQRGLSPDPDAYKTWDNQYYSKASSFTGWDGGAFPEIDVPAFTRDVWNDPFLSPKTQAATAGLVQGASAISGGIRTVSPLDVAKMTAGMGTGYLSGAIVGKVLGALTGMPSETQQKLRNAGTWAGIVSNIIPIAFR